MDEVVRIGNGQDLMAMVDNLKEGDTITMINSDTGDKVVIEGAKVTPEIYAEARKKEAELHEIREELKEVHNDRPK